MNSFTNVMGHLLIGWVDQKVWKQVRDHKVLKLVKFKLKNH